MTRYKFKFKRRWFCKTFTVIGHSYADAQDKMVLYFEDGSIREIKKWKNCELSLGTDWVNVTKKSMEAKAGQTIPLAVG